VALVKGSTYENVFYEYVLSGLKSIFNSEFTNSAKVYVAPEILYPDNFQIRLWGNSSSTNEFWQSGWQKEYDVDISLYMIEKNPQELFYKQLYQDSERLYQLLHNNRTKSITVGSTTLTWIDANVSDVVINSFDGEEEDIDGLNTAKLSFTCLVERST
tara:strand:+ start:10856 stop:11329 length:474 start_codon:yes stop_codon:yes gene_type:complete